MHFDINVSGKEKWKVPGFGSSPWKREMKAPL
jgi:hypothetical protein